MDFDLTKEPSRERSKRLDLSHNSPCSTLNGSQANSRRSLSRVFRSRLLVIGALRDDGAGSLMQKLEGLFMVLVTP